MNISAIITTYNRPAWLAEAISSVIAQSRPVQEILVVDSGAVEQTKTVAESFGTAVRYLRMDDRGLAAARNFGMRFASGDWLAFLDDDDQWLPEKIKLQEQALEGLPTAALVYTSRQMLWPDGTTTTSAALAPERLWPALRAANSIPPSSVMVQKRAILNEGGFNEALRYCEDWDLWVRLARKHQFAAVLEPVTKYRVSAGQMSANIELLLSTTEQILESSLLQGLGGITRSCWRRRIRAAQLFSAAILARDAGLPTAHAFARKSLAQWPAPAFQPKRFWFLVREFWPEWRRAESR